MKMYKNNFSKSGKFLTPPVHDTRTKLQKFEDDKRLVTDAKANLVEHRNWMRIAVHTGNMANVSYQQSPFTRAAWTYTIPPAGSLRPQGFCEMSLDEQEAWYEEELRRAEAELQRKHPVLYALEA